MPIPKKYRAHFEPELIYHVYNRTNNKEKLFLCDENYDFFLRKAFQHLSGLMNFLSWNLLPNHFHLAVEIKSEKEIREWLISKEFKLQTQIERKYLDNIISENMLIEHAFKRFFQSYALSFNKAYKRKGNLFYKNFKRILIEKNSQYTQLLVYIIANALKHGIHDDFTTYKWNSWNDLMNDNSSKIKKENVIGWFGSKKSMMKAIFEMAQYYYSSEISIEE